MVQNVEEVSVPFKQSAIQWDPVGQILVFPLANNNLLIWGKVIRTHFRALL